MIYYFIRVFDDEGDDYREYDITTAKGPDLARLFAFLMDGGCGAEYEDDGVMELAKMHTDIVWRRSA